MRTLTTLLLLAVSAPAAAGEPTDREASLEALGFGDDFGFSEGDLEIARNADRDTLRSVAERINPMLERLTDDLDAYTEVAGERVRLEHAQKEQLRELQRLIEQDPELFHALIEEEKAAAQAELDRLQAAPTLGPLPRPILDLSVTPAPRSTGLQGLDLSATPAPRSAGLQGLKLDPKAAPTVRFDDKPRFMANPALSPSPAPTGSGLQGLNLDPKPAPTLRFDDKPRFMANPALTETSTGEPPLARPLGHADDIQTIRIPKDVVYGGGERVKIGVRPQPGTSQVLRDADGNVVGVAVPVQQQQRTWAGWAWDTGAAVWSWAFGE